MIALIFVNALFPSAAPATLGEGWLAGMEIELTGEIPLGNIFRYFTIRVPELQRKKLLEQLDAAAIDAYLTPETLAALPAEVQGHLTGGEPIGVGKIERLDRSLLGADGQRLRPISGSEVAARPAESPGAPGIFLTPAQTAEQKWLEVQKRWHSLPLPERRQWIELDLLPPRVKVALFQQGKGFKPNQLVLREGLTPPIDELFRRLEWVMDINALEFRHREPLADPRQVARDIETFADLAQIRQYMDHPETPEPGKLSFSVHFHLSKEGHDSRRLAQSLNGLRLLELAEQGRAANPYGIAGYQTNVEFRGLVRLIERNRIEGRTHVLRPREEIARLQHWMSLPEAEALAQIQARIDDKVALLEQRLLSASQGDTPLLRSAVMALLEIRPQSPALRTPLALRLVDAHLLSSEDPFIRGELSRIFSRAHVIEGVMLDLPNCENLRCVRRRLEALKWMASTFDRRENLAQGLAEVLDHAPWARTISAVDLYAELWQPTLPFQDVIDRVVGPRVLAHLPPDPWNAKIIAEIQAALSEGRPSSPLKCEERYQRFTRTRPPRPR